MPHPAMCSRCACIDWPTGTMMSNRAQQLSREPRVTPDAVPTQSAGKPVSIARSLQSAIAMTATSPHKIRVEVITNYVGEQSKPEESHYVFAYTITIRNEGQVPARLLTRH